MGVARVRKTGGCLYMGNQTVGQEKTTSVFSVGNNKKSFFAAVRNHGENIYPLYFANK